MIEEFEIKINKRNTIIRYNEEVDIKQLVENIETYRKSNKWKLKTFAIEHDNFIIIDKEYKKFQDSNTNMFYSDNQQYITNKSFRPKGRIINILRGRKNG